MRRQVISVYLFFQLMALIANAQQSPIRHITYSDPGDFTDKSQRWIGKKTAKQEKKFSPAIAADFAFQMQRLHSFSAWLDSIYDEVKTEFSVCRDVSKIDPTRFHVQILAKPFPVAGYPADLRAAGTVSLDGYFIRVVYWNKASWGGLQNAVDLYRWELRNGFHLITGGHDELGARAACQ